MDKVIQNPPLVRFGTFELDLPAGEWSFPRRDETPRSIAELFWP